MSFGFTDITALTGGAGVNDIFSGTSTIARVASTITYGLLGDSLTIAQGPNGCAHYSNAPSVRFQQSVLITGQGVHELSMLRGTDTHANVTVCGPEVNGLGRHIAEPLDQWTLRRSTLLPQPSS